MDAMTISRADLLGLAEDLLGSGIRVVGPAKASRGMVEYRAVAAASELALEGPELPARSLKEFYLPPTEPLFAWKSLAGGKVELMEARMAPPPTVVIGARPCDAAGVEVLDKVMGWDYRDEPYFARREATTIVSIACAGIDSSCFCTSVGLGPDATRGSDLLLVPIEGGYRAEVLTEKGARLVSGHQGRFRPDSGAAQAQEFKQKARAKVAAHAPPDARPLRSWLETHFDHPLWAEVALRCHGCGACAAVCPTCHCFDIVDEPEGVTTGVRRRNWDTCQTARFTVHASGHNPRSDQNSRIRQRVMHKFMIYPKRFNEILCTGCGRCVRACPGGMDLLEVISRVSALAGGAG